MTRQQIQRRISAFKQAVESDAKEIAQAGNASWLPIGQPTEPATVRAFLTQKGAGVDYLNRRIARLLSTGGRVVKFAGLFLHSTPMVKGWKLNGSARKRRNGACELADLMTVFLYLDSNKAIRRMRCVMFQAKMEPSKGKHVIDDPVQRKLYNDCDGFDYSNGSVAPAGESRRLPNATSRKKALQFMFVKDRPVNTRTLPTDQAKGSTMSYGVHLVRFLKGTTGLEKGKRTSDWNQITTELIKGVAEKLYTDGEIRGPGITDLLNHFNSFEDHETWCINHGKGDEGFGIQFVIVWDGEISCEQTQVDTKPKIVGKKVKAPVTSEAEEQELEIAVEDERQIQQMDVN